MKTIMDDEEIRTIEQVRRFLEGTEPVAISIETKRERYEWIGKTFERFRYLGLSKDEKGLVLSYITKLTGYSRVQIKRLARRYFESGEVRRLKAAGRGFKRKYTDADIELLARTDELHETLSGPATKKICERAYLVFHDERYSRLAGISVAHVYNLRKSGQYRCVRVAFTKTRPVRVAIGERRKPRPEGEPGHIRVDTVHQGDLDGIKGVYHINAVDEVTQFEIVCCVEAISENHLIPVLEDLLGQFPFIVRGFHTDNGSEFINHNVAGLLNSLLIKLTKSRARQTNDNALVESKNGSVVRKHLGYVHIPQEHAPQINSFLKRSFNPYINYHRPCFFPVVYTDKKGKQKKRYPYETMMTPYEKLRSLEKADTFLKPGRTFEELDSLARRLTDNQAAELLRKEKNELFRKIERKESRRKNRRKTRTAKV